MKSEKLKSLIKQVSKAIDADIPDFKVKKSIVLLNKISNGINNLSIDNKEKTGLINDELNLLNKILKSQLAMQEIQKSDDIKKRTILFNDLHKVIDEVGSSMESIDLQTSKSFQLVVGLLTELKNKKYPTKIEVTNPSKSFKNISVDNFPEDIAVNNFNDIKFPDKIKVKNLSEIKFPKAAKSFQITNFPKSISVKQPVWYKKFNVSNFLTKLNDILDKTSDKLFKIQAPSHQLPLNALAVRLVDKDGKFIDKIIPDIRLPLGSGNSGQMQILDSDGNKINPAKEDGNLVSILTELGQKTEPANTQKTEEQETVPTDASKNNGSYAYSYTSDQLTQIDWTIGGAVYRKSFTYSSGLLATESAWVAV